jgi:hypothetical protein
MRTIQNPERGCGRLRAGGYYAQGGASPYGTLIDAWCLATCIEGRHNVFVKPINNRQLELIDLPATLMAGEIRLPSDPAATGVLYPALKNLPRLALLDHVGSKFYTPYEFAQEVFTHGPSRRIPEQVAAQIAQYTPMPIVFTHSDIPLFKDDGHYDENHDIACSWQNPKWGLYVGMESGADHWVIDRLLIESQVSQFESPHHEQIFFISWINRIVYVTNEDDDQDKIERLKEKGIEPVIAALPDEVTS